MGDDEDGEWDGDYDDGWDYENWCPKGGVSSLTVAGTQTQTQTVAAAASSGAGGGGNGRPPRPNSAGAPSAAGSADRRSDKRTPPSGGGGGGGGGPNGDPSGDPNGNGGPERNAQPRRRAHETDDSDRGERGSRKKEGDEVKFPNLPKHASEFQAWLDNVIDAVVACARDGKLAFVCVDRAFAQRWRYLR